MHRIARHCFVDPMVGHGKCAEWKPDQLGLSLTNAVAPNGQQPLSSLEIWRDGANAAVGLPDCSVELVYYDDQSTQFQDAQSNQSCGRTSVRPKR